MLTPIKNSFTKRIPAETKLSIALDAIKQKQSITELSKQYQCSRTTVHQQKNTLIDAANKAFQPEDDEVLFYIPVKKQLIVQTVLALFLIIHCHWDQYLILLMTHRAPPSRLINPTI